MQDRFLVFDIGGTYVRGALFDPGGGILGEVRVASTPNFINQPDLGPTALIGCVVDEVARIASSLTAARPPAAVVVGWPGPIGPDGVALRSPTILGPANDGSFDIRSILRRRLGTPSLAVLNDLTSAGWLYVGRGHKDFCIVTVGSGIGHKVFAQGRPLVGPSGRGGEMGHIAAIHPLADPSGKAARAIVGDISSGRGTLAIARALGGGPDLSSEDLVARFRGGDPLARHAVSQAARPLAEALAATHALVGTERFIMTGGFAVALGEGYRQILVDHAVSATWDLGQDWNGMIALGGRLDGLEGAAAYARTAAWAGGVAG